MNETYVSIRITNYGMNNPENHGYIYIDTGKLAFSHQIPFETAVKEMAKLAKALGRAPKLVTNWYGPDISYRELSGLV